MRHILKRKTKLIGHLIKHNTFIWNIFEGKVLGKRIKERPRTCKERIATKLIKIKSLDIKYIEIFDKICLF